MLINISDPIFQSSIFFALLLIAVVATAKRCTESAGLLNSHTNELKGVAILMVIFAHTGYFLATDTRFLFPLSVFAGVGVNLFLFLSGFGLTMSGLKARLVPLKFYKKRFVNIYFPMWIVITVLFILDYYVLNKTYSFRDVINSYLGLFPIADIYTSFNSPLWYFSFITFYYLLFPLVFSRRAPLLSIFLVVLVSLATLNTNLPVSVDVLKLYKLHILAFPLGMLFAVLGARIPNVLVALPKMVPSVKSLVIIVLAYIFSYTALNSGVGKSIRVEQMFSLVTTVALIAIFILKRFQSQFLILIGVYSYEIYLIQWPIMYRYDFLYKNLSASVATFLYLLLFLTIAMLIRKIETFTKTSLK